MRKGTDQYVFAGILFLSDRGIVEVCETNRTISLSQIHRNFLLALVEKAGDVVTYEELRVKVWPHEPQISQRVQHNMHVTKGHLVKLLEEGGIKVDFIESVPGQGYRLAAKVSPAVEEETEQYAASQRDVDDSTPPQVVPHEAEQTAHQGSSTILSRLLGRHSTFITVSSILFGLLFWIALLLETAYQFNVYDVLVIWLGLLLTVINTIAGAASLVFSRKRLRKNKRGGLFAGLGMLIASVFGSCWLASLYLPDTPVTLTEFQAQPAFGAFLKNAVLYFLPLFVFLLLIPFYYVAALELKVQRVIAALPADAIFIGPHILMIICFAAIIYSLVSTFYLLDHLQLGKYHGLFVSLIFIRFIVYFGLAVGSVLWYKTALNKASIPQQLS